MDDYVKLISRTDLDGNKLDSFYIRAKLAAQAGSRVNLLLEAFLVDCFSTAILNHDSSKQELLRKCDLLFEAILLCNVFLDTDISCQRLARKLLNWTILNDEENALDAPKYKLDSSNGDDKLWIIFWRILLSQQNAQSLFRTLRKHLLINLRGNVTDTYNYQKYVETVFDLGQQIEEDINQCTCSQSIIPVFLTMCGHRANIDRSLATSSSSSRSVLIDSFDEEEREVRQFWRQFRQQPSTVFPILTDRLKRLIESISDDHRYRQLPCYCQCHHSQWREHLTNRFRKNDSTDYQEPAVRHSLLTYLCKLIGSMFSLKSGIIYTEILYDPTPNKVDDTKLSTESSDSSSIKNEASTTSVWSVFQDRLPLQPDADFLLQRIQPLRDLSGLDQFNEEPDLLARPATAERWVRWSTAISTRSPSNTVSDVESLPYDDLSSDREINQKIASVIVTSVKATSPLLFDMEKTQKATVETQTSNKSMEKRHFAVQTELTRNHHVSTATVLRTMDAQSQTQFKPTGSVTDWTDMDHFLYVQKMRDDDVEKLFKSALAFADIC